MASVVTDNVKKLSHKAFRALLKKFRRKKKRQLIARERERQEKLVQEKRESSPNFKAKEEERERNAKLWDEFQERESNRKHRQWLYREEVAQQEFRRKKIMKDQELANKEEERKKMLAELEEQNAAALAAADKIKNEKAKKEEALQAALSGLPESNGPWHNPIAPENYRTEKEAKRDECQFFAKTGCCRFGDVCSRGHTYPESSCTILIKNMFSHYSISQSHRDDYDTDMGLEFEDGDMYDDFRDFYEDVLPEFRTCGNVAQFKVCCNHEPHLRGNVYVQFKSEEAAIKAYQKFNGRFYAGKQLTCQFTNIIKWRLAICGLYASNRCPKGVHCNFLHVFRNPKGEYLSADYDLPAHRKNRNRSHRNDFVSSSHHSERQHSSRSRTGSRHLSSERSRTSDSRRESVRYSSSSRKRRYSLERDDIDDGAYENYSLKSERLDADSCHSSRNDRSERHSQRTTSASSLDSQSDNETASSKKHRKKKKKHKKSKKKKKSSRSHDDENGKDY